MAIRFADKADTKSEKWELVWVLLRFWTLLMDFMSTMNILEV